MIEHEEDELRSAFRALRKEDQAGSPSYDAVLANARAIRAERDIASVIAHNAVPRRPFTRPIILAGAAAAVVLAVALTTYRIRSHVTSPVGVMPNVPLSISAWKSPTRALLRTPGRELITPKPLLSSVLGDIRVPPALRKGGGD